MKLCIVKAFYFMLILHIAFLPFSADKLLCMNFFCTCARRSHSIQRNYEKKSTYAKCHIDDGRLTCICLFLLIFKISIIRSNDVIIHAILCQVLLCFVTIINHNSLFLFDFDSLLSVQTSPLQLLSCFVPIFMLHVAIFNLYYIFNTIRISIVPTNKRILIDYTNINKFCILMVFAGHLF